MAEARPAKRAKTLQVHHTVPHSHVAKILECMNGEGARNTLRQDLRAQLAAQGATETPYGTLVENLNFPGSDLNVPCAVHQSVCSDVLYVFNQAGVFRVLVPGAWR